MKGGQRLLVVRVVYGVRKTTGGGSLLETATKDLLIDAKTWERWTNEGVREWKGKAMQGQYLEI